jgi:two-component system response regulator FixJ
MSTSRVLVVEDERKIAQILASALQAEHYDVVVAPTGEDGFFRANAEVFDLVVQGYTSHAIGERLQISTRTVEGYRVQIMEKMQAESVAVLIRQAFRLGLIAP